MEEPRSKFFFNPEEFIGGEEDKPYKATLNASDNMLVGITRLAPGQSQPVHIHVGEDKLYMVLAGTGYFQVGNEYQNAGPGTLVWAPAALQHSVINNAAEVLVLYFVISPSPIQP
jgi:quercetin dioxygenase-like cupin family protein